MKTLKRILSMMLVVCMIFTSQAFVTFAEGMENTEAIENETTIEETTVEADDDLVGAKLGETDPVGASSASAEEETAVGEKLGEPEGADITLQSSTHDDNIEETDYPEEPEEEATVGAKLGEPEGADITLQSSTPDGLLVDIVISQYTIKTYYVGDTYDPSNLKIQAYYVDDYTGDEEMVEVAYTDDTSRFSFNPDCVNNPFTESTTEENPYLLEINYTDDHGGEASVTTEFQVYPASAPTTYTVTYNQNLPEGYNLSEGKIWYADATSDDLENDYIELEGNADMTCEDTSGNVRTLEGWNTAAGGAGTSYVFGETINDATKFTEDTLDLYAVWSEPVAPAPTAFAYWKIDGDDANKTIHYYATAGEGRTAVTIDIGGIEYTGLDDSEREEIKKAVIEEPIVATDVRRLFYFFKGLVSITDLGKLDTTSATSFESMFHNCNAIEELDVSGLETNSLTDTSFMFSECSSLTKLTFGNYFDTSKVRSMPRMFVSCTEITELDLTSFNTSSVTDMNYMFFGCSNLKKIYVSDYFTVEKVDISDDMFTDSLLLEGGSGTRYSDVSEPYDKRYAHIDGGTTNPGFFSGASTPTTTYTVKYNQDLPTGYTLSGGMTWYTDSTTTDLTGNPIILKGSADMTCEDTSGNTRTLQSWNTQIEHKGNTFNFGAEFKDSQYFDPDPTCTLYAMWSDPVPPSPTPPTPGPTPPTPGPTPPGPNPPSPGGGETGGSSSGSSDPTHGPMGDLTKNPLYADTLNGTNNIPESKMVSNDTLATTLKSYPENANSPMVNARDDSGNVGYGQWLRVPNTTTWYFLSGSFNQGTGTTNTGFLANGWFNLGWDGQDKWYYFDSAGVMKIGWHQEGNKIYYLQADFSDNWYGKAMTGQQMIGGQIYNFDSNGALIQ